MTATAPARWRRSGSCARKGGLAAALVVLTAGCRPVSYSPMEDPELPRVESAQPIELPEGAVKPPDPDLVSDPDAPLPGANLAYGEVPDANKNNIEKADLYWNLVWVKKTFTPTYVPEDIEEILAKMGKRAAAVLDDDDKPVIRACIKLYQVAVEAVRVQEEMAEVRLDRSRVPWGSGRLNIERELSEYWERTNEKTPGDELPLRLQDALEKVLEFEAAHGSAPDTVLRRTLNEAGTQTDEIGRRFDLLGKERPEDRALLTDTP